VLVKETGTKRCCGRDFPWRGARFVDLGRRASGLVWIDGRVHPALVSKPINEGRFVSWDAPLILFFKFSGLRDGVGESESLSRAEACVTSEEEAPVCRRQKWGSVFGSTARGLSLHLDGRGRSPSLFFST